MPNQNSLRNAAPILIGVSIMLSLSMGMRQSLGLFVQPAVKDLSLAVADFTLAIAVQNLVWGFLQPLAGAWAVRFGFQKVMTAGDDGGAGQRWDAPPGPSALALARRRVL